MNWTPITQALPPEGKVVETKDDGYDFGRVYLLYYDYDLDNWVGGHPKNYMPTHWRYKPVIGPTIDTDHPDGEAIREVLRKHGFGKNIK